VASGLINGDVILHSFQTSTEGRIEEEWLHHKKAVRDIDFTEDGKRLYSVGKDKSIICVDVESGKLKRRIKKAHENPIYSIAMTGDTFIATGDDNGVLKCWDMRSKTCTMEFKECEDYISDMVVEDNKIVIASSGEGTLTAFNVRRKRMDLQTELFDSDLLCLAKVKNGQKLVCGTSEGVLNMFHWGQWGNISDRFPLKKNRSIDSLVAISDDIVITGTSDGFLRAVHILPSRVLGPVGRHMEDFPILNLSLTHDQTCVVSCSHDERVKFWNVEEAKQQSVDISKTGTKEAKRNKLSFGKAKQHDFFADLVENKDPCDGHDGGNSDDDSDDDSD